LDFSLLLDSLFFHFFFLLWLLWFHDGQQQQEQQQHIQDHVIIWFELLSCAKELSPGCNRMDKAPLLILEDHQQPKHTCIIFIVVVGITKKSCCKSSASSSSSSGINSLSSTEIHAFVFYYL